MTCFCYIHAGCNWDNNEMIILFTNTTLNRLGFGETATVHSFSLSKQSSQNNTLNVTFFLRNPARDQVTKFGHGVT